MIETAVGVLRRRWWILVACLVVIPAAVYVQTVRQPKVYEASVVVQGGGEPFLQVGEVSVLNPGSPSFIEAYARAPQTTRETVRVLGGRRGTSGAITTEHDPRTGWVTLTAAGGDPGAVLRAANASASGLLRTLRAEAQRQVDAAIRQVERRLERTETTEGGAQARATLHELRAFRESPLEGLEVVQRPSVARVIGPHPVRNTALAVLLALLIAPALMLLAERLERRVRHPEQLAALAGAPLLGAVAGRRGGGVRNDPASREDFGRMRDSLLHFDFGAPLSSLVVAGPLGDEESTTVAEQLALALAKSGRRVVLVDADLRHRGLTARLDNPSASGLGDVLRGQPIEAALRVLPAPDGGIALLPAGSAGPDPGELFSGEALRSVVERLTSRFDLVVVDAPPVLLASDALPMLRQVSGMVCVARLDHTPQHAVQRMARLATAAGGRVVGVVATGRHVRPTLSPRVLFRRPARATTAGRALPG